METPQPPQVSVSGSIVIQGQLAAPSSPTAESETPVPPSSWWQCLRWKDFHKVTAYATSLLAMFTAILALGTIALVILNRCQINDLQNQFEFAQRPYVWWDEKIKDVSTKNIQPIMKVGQKASWDIHFINYGKSPAVSLFHREEVEFGKGWDKKIDPGFFTKEVHSTSQKDDGIALAPGEPLYATAYSKVVLTDDDIKYINANDNGINANDNGIAVIAYFEYFDLEGHEYHSEICDVRFVNGEIGRCRRYNKIH